MSFGLGGGILSWQDGQRRWIAVLAVVAKDRKGVVWRGFRLDRRSDRGAKRSCASRVKRHAGLTGSPVSLRRVKVLLLAELAGVEPFDDDHRTAAGGTGPSG